MIAREGRPGRARRRDGKELFYLSLERKMMAVAVKGVAGPQPAFEAAAPQELFDARIPQLARFSPTFPYEVAADGKRFLVNTTGEETGGEEPLTVAINWLAGVKR